MKKIILSIFPLLLLAQSGVKPVDNELYKKECASCHFGYQAGLLPQNSWKQMMGNLKEHFGTDASLDSEDEKAILEYLSQNSADNATEYKRSNKIMQSLGKKIPTKVSDTPYFIRKHERIPKAMVTQESVKSIANCKACHTTAEKGVYSERYIYIPNYGKYDD